MKTKTVSETRKKINAFLDRYSKLYPELGAERYILAHTKIFKQIIKIGKKMATAKQSAAKESGEGSVAGEPARDGEKSQ